MTAGKCLLLPFVSLLAFLVAVLTSPSHANDVTHVIVNEGDEVTLQCDLDTADPPQIRWQDCQNTVIVDPDSGVTSGNHGEASYRFSVDPKKPEQLKISVVSWLMYACPFHCESVQSNGEVQSQKFELDIIGDFDCSITGVRETWAESKNVELDCKVVLHRNISLEDPYDMLQWLRGAGNEAEMLENPHVFWDLHTVWAEYKVKQWSEENATDFTCRMEWQGYQRDCVATLLINSVDSLRSSLVLTIISAVIVMLRSY